MNVRKIVGLNVRKSRLDAGLSQEELAGRMDVEQFYVSGLEAGRRTIWKAAAALGVEAATPFANGGHRPELPAKKKRDKKR